MLFARNRERTKQDAAIEHLESRRLLSTVYFVAPTGSDTNNGTSYLTPFQTFDRVNQVDFNPGDQVLFQGGQRYYVQGTKSDNFLVNGDFEGDLDATWPDTMGTSAANSVITTDPTLVHGGTNALALGTGAAARAQDITSSVQSGQTYEIEFWTKVKTPGVGTDSIG